MLQNMIIYYETHGAYYLVFGLLLAVIVVPLWYGVSRAVRVALRSRMLRVYQQLQEFIENNPSKYKHHEPGIDRLVTIARQYREFQQSLNIRVIFEIMSSKPHNGEVVKSLRNCRNDKELSGIIYEISGILATTMFFATPWILIVTLLSLAGILLFTLLALVTRHSIKAFSWVKEGVAAKALTFDFSNQQTSISNPLFAP